MYNKKIVFFLFVLELCVLISCKRTTLLLIYDGKQYYKRYKLNTDDIQYKLCATFDYGLAKHLNILIEILNKSNNTIVYDVNSFDVSSDILNFEKPTFCFAHSDSSWTLPQGERRKLLIKPKNIYEIEISIWTEEMSVDESRKLWPWPKNENVKVDLGLIVKGENEIPLQSVFFTHQSVVEK